MNARRGSALTARPWAALAALLLGAACARYVTHPVECEPTPPAPALRPDTTRTASGVLAGRVEDEQGRGAVNHAWVLLYSDSSWRHERRVLRVDTTDVAGRFVFEELAPGDYVLRLRRIGYDPVPYATRLAHGPGLGIVVPARPMTTDGCGFAVVRERVPWWRFW